MDCFGLELMPRGKEAKVPLKHSALEVFFGVFHPDLILL